MHSTVFELSERPVPAGRWITPGYLPDWFFSGADYAERMSCAEREGSIAALVDCLGGDCIRQGDCLTFAPVLRERYFRERYRCFHAAAQMLANAEYEVFSGITPAPAFLLALHGLRESYEDRHGFYIYQAARNTLLPLDRWLRSADLSLPYYVGGTIHYHY